MENPYKRIDIFRCIHESHRGFKKKISVYHILKDKRCYPDGCIYFRWHCKELSKRNKCHRGFSHVGRKCFGCREFYEEKIHNYPEIQIGKPEFKEFMRELDDFEDWLDLVGNREIEIAGKIDAVKPRFTRKVYPKAEFLSFGGYLLTFKDIFLDRLHLEDFVYMQMSGNHYRSLKLGSGDMIEARAYLKVDRGRLVLYRVRSVDVISRGRPALWDEQSALVARETATEFGTQPEGCVQCPFGALVDVEYLKDHHSVSARRLFCLKGMKDHKDCYVRAEYCGLENEANDFPRQQCSPSRIMQQR